MTFIFRNLSLPLTADEHSIPSLICRHFQIEETELLSWKIVRKGIDARKKPKIKFIYTLEFAVKAPQSLWQKHALDPDLRQVEPLSTVSVPKLRTVGRTVIAGMGPAGLFAALRLREYGIPVLLIERGRRLEERIADVQAFWKRGELDLQSNVQFGEGGAGTFSDGKLTTRVRDSNISLVLKTLISFGAPEEIAWLAKPHIGTDLLRGIVTAMRNHLLNQGVEIRFNCRLTDLQGNGSVVTGVVLDERLEESCSALILAVGHSARDTYEMLLRRNVFMEPKPFAVGLRVEHPQELINRIQYGLSSHPKLPAADYSLAYNNSITGRSAYSFCMCPGGVVVGGSSECGGVVTNGMSSHQRNSPYANSALVVNVNQADFSGNSVLAGVEFQRQLERHAFMMGGSNYCAPAQNLLDFIGHNSGKGPCSTYRPGVVEADLTQLLPLFVADTLREGILYFDRKMRGFVSNEATLIGVESRTSAPLRIVRGTDFQSVTHQGLFPTGEGAGYAGGIMSAALDGLRVADAVAQQLAAGAIFR